MNKELLNLLYSYLAGQLMLSQLSEWIAINAWTPEEDAEDLINEIDVELAYLKDGVSDEDYFRYRIAELIDTTFEAAFYEDGVLLLSSTKSSAFADTINLSWNPSGVQDLRVEAVFA